MSAAAPKHPFALGLDAGGTATRIAIVDGAGRPVLRAEGPPLSGHLWLGDDRTLRESRLHALREAIAGFDPPLSAMRMGLTGIGEDAAAAARVAADLAALFGVPVDRTSVLNDVQIAYEAVFAPGDGVLVYAGTGSIAIHVDAAGQVDRCGGRGVIIDDAGGAYWIACAALRTVWRAIEEERPDARHAPLARTLFDHMGGGDWNTTRRTVYGGDRGTIGMLAIAVGKAADSGDPDAAGILDRAGAELARLGLVLARRHQRAVIGVAGGALRISPRLFAAVRRATPPEFTVRQCHPDSALGAARTALQAATGSLGKAEG